MRSRYPAGVPCWVDTTQPDPVAAAEFYRGIFGWQLEDSMPPGSPGRYFMARRDGQTVAAVSSTPGEAPGGAVWNTYIATADADATAARVAAAGGRVMTPPFDVVDSGRMAVCADAEGAQFSIWQARAHMGAEKVNEPGSWNWSNMNTRDPARATAFYAAVFGWETTAVNFGAGESYMLRMPGYADFLEEINPGVRQRHLDAGAPEGFTDTVGWLQPISDERPAHWDVTFSVDDADAVTERARSLGATILVPPFDVPYARMAVLRDPQGAAFSISKFVPPQE